MPRGASGLQNICGKDHRENSKLIRVKAFEIKVHCKIHCVHISFCRQGATTLAISPSLAPASECLYHVFWYFLKHRFTNELRYIRIVYTKSVLLNFVGQTTLCV